MSQNELAYIPLKDIEVKENFSLRGVDPSSEKIIGMAASMKEVGVLNSINVKSDPDNPGKYILVDGLQRFTAAGLAGLETIPAQISSTTDELTTLTSQFIANVHKVETKPVEYAKQIKRILALDPLMTLTTLANKICRSEAYLLNIMGLTKLGPKAAELVNSGEVGLSNAYVLSKLPDDEQDLWVERAMTQSPAEFIPSCNERIKQIKEARRQGRAPSPAVYVPVARARKLLDLKSEMDAPKLGTILCKELSSPLDGYLMGIKFALHLDPESIRQAKEKEESRRKQAEEEKAKRDAEKEAKKAAAAKEKLKSLDAVA